MNVCINFFLSKNVYLKINLKKSNFEKLEIPIFTVTKLQCLARQVIFCIQSLHFPSVIYFVLCTGKQNEISWHHHHIERSQISREKSKINGWKIISYASLWSY